MIAVPNPSPFTNRLRAVAAISTSDVWAVGQANTPDGLNLVTLIEHWNGTVWSVFRSPNATNGYNLLNGIALVAANDVWTVGQAANGSTYSTLVEHWDGVS